MCRISWLGGVLRPRDGRRLPLGKNANMHYAQINNTERPKEPFFAFFFLTQGWGEGCGWYFHWVSKQQCIYKKQRHSFAFFFFFLLFYTCSLLLAGGTSAGNRFRSKPVPIQGTTGVSDGVPLSRLFRPGVHIQTVTLAELTEQQVEEALLDWLVFIKSLLGLSDSSLLLPLVFLVLCLDARWRCCFRGLMWRGT